MNVWRFFSARPRKFFLRMLSCPRGMLDSPRRFRSGLRSGFLERKNVTFARTAAGPWFSGRTRGSDFALPIRESSFLVLVAARFEGIHIENLYSRTFFDEALYYAALAFPTKI
jgi:hypothetical protein